MHRNQSVNVHQFAMVPKAEIPRSSFIRQSTHKTTFDENYLIPVFVDEVLPGDMMSLKMTAFARLSTPIYPIMDNMYLDSFFFFVPCRLLWENWTKFMGEQTNPGDSIDYTVPITTTPIGGAAVGSIMDYFGIPTAPQLGAINTGLNALPLRAYNLIWNQWFRDENLQDSVLVPTTDGPDDRLFYNLLKRGKRPDYFTSCLPWAQKGDPVTVPLGTTAPVIPTGNVITPGFRFNNQSGAQAKLQAADTTTPPGGIAQFNPPYAGAGLAPLVWQTAASGGTGLIADLTTATAVTINQLRQSFQIQKLLERDARGGTRYTELIRAHFGVINPDFRLQRPEYLGGGSVPINISPISQTSATTNASETGSTPTPLGTLAAYGTILAQNHGFTQAFTEHGYIIGLVNIRADITYQQGLRKLWSRETRYDFYFPVFAMLGEQPVLNQEIYMDGGPDNQAVFGFNERWAEYRYFPSMITGQFRSTYPETLDAWHLAENFTARPALNAQFIQSAVPVPRVIAVEQTGAHFIFDSFFNINTTRAMPLYSVPGMIDHF